MKKNLLAIIFASFCAGTLSAQNIAWPEVTMEAKPGARLEAERVCRLWFT